MIDIEEVIYDPLIFAVPVAGRINNPAHSLIVFTTEFLKDQAKEPETLLKIRNHAKDRRVVVDRERVEELVEKYRSC